MSKSELVNETMKAAPPITVAGLTVAGVSLNDIVLLVTLIYVLLQIGFLAHRWYRLLKKNTGEKQ